MPTSTDSGTPSLSQPSQDVSPFFISGGTLHPGALSYVERQADGVLLQTLLRGEFCYILDTRQVGKSSLMVRTKARLEKAGVRVAILDLTTIGRQVSITQWYEGLVSMLGEQTGLEAEVEEFWDRNRQRGPLQAFELAIRRVVLPVCDAPLVIFVDEIDAVRSLPFSTDEFFAAIRAFFNQRAHDPSLSRLTFCLLGVASPAELVRDTKTTPFNIGRRIELKDFSAGEAAPLAAGLGRDRRTGSRRLRRVLYWTGGHPYLTQRLCEAVAAGKVPSVDRLCRSLFFTQEAPEQNDNLTFVRRRLLESDTDLAGMLDLYRRLRYSRRRILCAEADPRVGLLRLSGIARTEAGCLRVRNRIYARVFDRAWIKSVIPGAELRRQRAAFWKGVTRTLAVTVLLLGTVWFGGGAWLDRDPVVTIPKRTDPVPNAYDDFERARQSLTSADEVHGAYESIYAPVMHLDKATVTRRNTAALFWVADIIWRNPAALHWLRSGLAHDFRPKQSDLLIEYSSLAKLLVLEGQVKASHGDWGGAADSDLDAIALGERLGEGGSLANWGVGVLCETVGQRALEKTINHLNLAQATSVSRRITALIQADNPLWRRVEEQKWWCQSLLLGLLHDPHWRDDLQGTNYGLGDTYEMPNVETPQREMERFMIKMRLMTMSKCSVMDEVTNYFDAWILMLQQQEYSIISHTERESKSSSDIIIPVRTKGGIGEIFNPKLDRPWCQDTGTKMRLRLLLIATALRACRLTTGRYPKQLYQLKPAYLKISPNNSVDCLDDEFGWGISLHYTIHGNSYLLYSVGPDGLDDHGQPGSVWPDAKGDLVFGHLFRVQ